MPWRVPGIHVLVSGTKVVDGRTKSGHDDCGGSEGVMGYLGPHS